MVGVVVYPLRVLVIQLIPGVKWGINIPKIAVLIYGYHHVLGGHKLWFHFLVAGAIGLIVRALRYGYIFFRQLGKTIECHDLQFTGEVCKIIVPDMGS